MATILNKAGNKQQGTSIGDKGQGVASSVNPQVAAPNASGNFTNVSNYLKSNQQAGQRIGEGLQQKTSADLKSSQLESDKQVGQLNKNIGEAQNTLQRGQGYLQDLNKSDFNAQQFLNTPMPTANGATPSTKLEDFSKFRTGAAVSQQDLQKQQQSAITANQQAQQNVAQKKQGVSTEQGRYGLLQNYLGNRGYRSGLQNLDQTFLQTQGQKQIQDINKDLQQRSQKLNESLQSTEKDSANKIAEAVKQQKELSSNLGTKTSELEKSYISGLENKVSDVNAQREAERQRNRDFYRQLYGIKSPEGSQQNIKAQSDALLASILKDPKNAGRTLESMQQEATAAAQAQASQNKLDQGLLSEAGLQLGEQTFNVFNQPTSYEELFNEDARNAQTYQDVASQKDVDYYKALSNLAGIENAKLSGVSSTAVVDPVTGEVIDAASLKQGQGSIRNKLDQAKFDFLKNALGANLSGYDSQSYDRGFLRGKGYENVTLNANVADLLAGGNAETYRQMVERSVPVGESLYALGAAQTPIQQLINPAPELYDSIRNTITGTSNAAMGAMDDIFSSFLGLGWGDNREAKRAAAATAQQRLQNNINSYLSNQGFNKFLGDTGVQTGSLNISDYGYGRPVSSPDTVKTGAQPVNTTSPGFYKDYVAQNLSNYLKGNVE